MVLCKCSTVSDEKTLVYLSLTPKNASRQVGIAWRLNNPTKDVLELYGDTIVVAIRDSTYLFALTVMSCWIPNVAVWLSRQFCTIRVIQVD